MWKIRLFFTTHVSAKIESSNMSNLVGIIEYVFILFFQRFKPKTIHTKNSANLYKKKMFLFSPEAKYRIRLKLKIVAFGKIMKNIHHSPVHCVGDPFG